MDLVTVALIVRKIKKVKLSDVQINYQVVLD